MSTPMPHGKAPKRPWYARETGRWHHAIEAALASDSTRRRNFAWMILLSCGGAHGCQQKFANLLGVGRSQVGAWLSGANEIGDAPVKRIAKAIGRQSELLDKPGHPLGISYPASDGLKIITLEPSDDPEENQAWEQMWAIVALRDPTNAKTSHELREKWPDLFPEGDVL